MSEGFQSFEFWEIPADAAVREQPPTTISNKHKADFDATLRAADQAGRTRHTDLFVYLGLDMGTSSTKVVARLPLEPGRPCIPIPAPRHCRSDNHPALWQTVLWKRGATLLAYPSDGAHPLHNLKQAAMINSLSSRTPVHHLAQPIQAVTAYLGYVIRHTKGWLLTNRASMFRRRTPRWIVHVGLPAKSYEETQLAHAYRRMALAGMHLSQSPNEIALSDVAEMLGRDSISHAAASNEESLKQGVAVFPEIAAATTSFSKSNERANGLYLIADVGAMTMDTCAFYLGKEEGSDTYSVFAADVRPLGVEAYHWFLQNGRRDDEFRAQVSTCLHDVVTKTKRECRNADEFRRGNDLPTFLVGGGSNSRLHEEQLKKLSQWMDQHYFHNGLRRLEISVPTAIDITSIEDGQNPSSNRQGIFGRALSRLIGSSSGRPASATAPVHGLSCLFVALGLSYPDDEIGKVILPKDIPPMPPDTGTGYGRNFVSKDEV